MHSSLSGKIGYDLLRDSLLAVHIGFLVKLGGTLFNRDAPLLSGQSHQLEAIKDKNRALN